MNFKVCAIFYTEYKVLRLGKFRPKLVFLSNSTSDSGIWNYLLFGISMERNFGKFNNLIRPNLLLCLP